MIGEHPGRGDTTQVRRKKASGLMGALCVWSREEERAGEGGGKKKRGERIQYIHLSNPLAPTVLYFACFTGP